MNIKNIFGFICMLAVTILGVIFILASSLVLEINSSGIMKAANETNYFEVCKKDAEEVLRNYMPEEKVDSILEEIDVKTDVIGLINGFDSVKIDALSNDIKSDVKSLVEQSLDENILDKNKHEFSKIVSNAFMAEIFPVEELDLVSRYSSRYIPYLKLGIIASLVIVGLVCICLIICKENRRWLIVSLYNIVIFSCIIAIMLSMFNNIVIGSEKTTELLLSIISNIQCNIYIFSSILFVISIVLNYLFYCIKTKNNK